MKKLLILLCTIVFSLGVGLTACGIDEAKVTGIHVAVTLPDADSYSDALENKTTLPENDYTVQVGEKYDLTVELTQYGGSKFAAIALDGITLRYDHEIFDIERPTDEYASVVRYVLTCKRAVYYAAVIVEVSKYSETVIISAER